MKRISVHYSPLVRHVAEHGLYQYDHGAEICLHGYTSNV